MDWPQILTLVTSAAAGTGAVVTASIKWVLRQLEECKSEHRESRNRIEELHDEIKVVSITVGELKGQLTAYKRIDSSVDRNPEPI